MYKGLKGGGVRESGLSVLTPFFVGLSVKSSEFDGLSVRRKHCGVGD